MMGSIYLLHVIWMALHHGAWGKILKLLIQKAAGCVACECERVGDCYHLEERNTPQGGHVVLDRNVQQITVASTRVLMQ